MNSDMRPAERVILFQPAAAPLEIFLSQEINLTIRPLPQFSTFSTLARSNYGTTATSGAKTHAAADRAKRLHFTHHPTDPTQRSEDGEDHRLASDLWYFLQVPGADASDAE